MVYDFDAKIIHGHYTKIDWGGGNMPSAEYIEVPSDGLPHVGAEKAGVPVDGSTLPKKMIWRDRRAYPPADIDKSPRLNLSERAKTVIEAVEPGIHQFFPVDYFWGNGEKIETRYWLYICNRRDAIHPTKSNMILDAFGEYAPPLDGVDMGWEIPSHVDVNAPAKFVLDGSKIRGAHLWREVRADGYPMISETMYSAIMDAGLTGYYTSEKKEIV